MVTAADEESRIGVAAQLAVADQVKQVLNAAPVTPSYRAALEAALALPGNIMSDTPNAHWAWSRWTCLTI